MNRVDSEAHGVLDLRVGERVRVKSRHDILATLDQDGMLDNLPFMPEMLHYCGREYKVFKRADKTCDTIGMSAGRRMMHAVHLEDGRCDGAAHDGCGAKCLLFWKEAWLERVDGRGKVAMGGGLLGATGAISPKIITEAQLLATAIRPPVEGAEPGEVYRCQATELRNATMPLPSSDLSQYVRDVKSGNVGVGSILSALAFRSFQQLLKLRGYRFWLAAYDWLQKLRGGVTFPYKQGRVVGKTPSAHLNLQPGELVQIKSHDEILDTLNEKNRNRGLWFDAEQVPYCGKTARVLCRVEKIINEKTGRVIKLPNDCLILEDVYCRAHYSSDRLFCPRSIYSYWHEVWLKRVNR